MWDDQSDVVVSSACQSSGREPNCHLFGICEGMQGSQVDQNLLKVPFALLFYYL